MFFIKHHTFIIVTAFFLIMAISQCKKDSSPAAATTYQLLVKDQLGVSGTVTFTQTSSTITTINIVLTGSDAVPHPAYIRLNSAVEKGAIYITLNTINGGTSTTQVTQADNGNAINYTQLIAYDAYIDVYESLANQTLILAEGDIGGNALTGSNKAYVLDTVGTIGVSGTVVFAQRANGNTLATVSLIGTLTGGVYPAAIYLGSVATVGGEPVVVTLNPVQGALGKGFTTIRTLNSGTALTYNNLLVYDGYLAIQQSLTMPNIICQGNIGTH